MSAFLSVMRAARVVVRGRRALRGALRPGWDEDYETFATVMHRWSKLSVHFPLSVQRDGLRRMARRTPETRRVSWEPADVGGVRCEWVRTADSDPRRVLVYLHGGGYSIGSIDSHRDLFARLCLSSGLTVLAVEYRLAPEHPFPAQLEDSLRVYSTLLRLGFEPRHLAIAGESAGGGLTLSTLLALRDERLPQPAAGITLSPWFDLEATGDSMRENAAYDYVHRDVLLAYTDRFVRSEDRRNPLAAPLHADLRGIAPLLIQAGAAETLRDDSVRFAERARAAGVHVELEVWPDMVHAWHLFAPAFEVSRRAVDRVAAYAKTRTAAGHGSDISPNSRLELA